MRRYAVGYIGWHNHELVIEIIRAPSWQEALRAHSRVGDEFEFNSEDKNKAKQDFFDSDAMFEVKEISE